MKQGGVSPGTSILKYLRQNCLSYAKLSQQKPHHIISWGTGKRKIVPSGTCQTLPMRLKHLNKRIISQNLFRLTTVVLINQQVIHHLLCLRHNQNYLLI